MFASRYSQLARSSSQSNRNLFSAGHTLRNSSRRACKASGSGGFTLIELLVVIAIIAILAAILFPVFATAREKARQTACLSNMKQIGSAVQMYAQDYDEGLPAWNEYYGKGAYDDPTEGKGQLGTMGDASAYTGGWQFKLQPYVKSGDLANRSSTGLWKCPSQGTKGDPELNSLGGVNLSYGMQGHLNQFNPRNITSLGPRYYQYPKLVAMDSPTITIYAGEGGSDGRIGSPRDEFWIGGNRLREIPNRHNEGANYVFCDGHVKWLKHDNVYPKAFNSSLEWRAIINYFAYTDAERKAGYDYCAPNCP